MAQEFPRMLYGEGGTTMIVRSAEEQQAAGSGWATEPEDAHRAQAATTQPLQSGQEPFVEAVAQRTAELVLAALGRASTPFAEPEDPPAAPRKRLAAKDAPPADTIIT